MTTSLPTQVCIDEQLPCLEYRLTQSITVTALQARTFAVWTLTSAVVRGYAAYNIHNKTCVPFNFPRRASCLNDAPMVAFTTWLCSPT